MPCIQSIADAKASFASRVNDGIATLMACGYSRERATNSLLRELNRGESCTRPSDEEVSHPVFVPRLIGISFHFNMYLKLLLSRIDFCSHESLQFRDRGSNQGHHC